tara:strand:- start:102 stop:395 length:294 start_codon:yes stop_codon:yes gene_type:complete
MTATLTNLKIQHDADKHMFYAKVKGGNAELSYAKHGHDYLDFQHTYVPDASRGFGVASTIVEFAMEFAKQNQIKVKPTCPFVKDFIRENPEYQSITI